MRVNRNTLLIVALGLALYAGWSSFGSGAREVAVMRTIDAHGTHSFTSLWVVDGEHGFSWIRAHRPDRRWLPVLQENPKVQLRRAGRTGNYFAQVFDDPLSRAYVAPYFYEKYGLADILREFVSGTDTVPIRLEPR